DDVLADRERGGVPLSRRRRRARVVVDAHGGEVAAEPHLPRPADAGLERALAPGLDGGRPRGGRAPGGRRGDVREGAHRPPPESAPHTAPATPSPSACGEPAGTATGSSRRAAPPRAAIEAPAGASAPRRDSSAAAASRAADA